MADTRAKKSGIGADIEKKLEQRYDEAHNNGTTEAIKIWINAVVGADHTPIPSSEQKDLHRALADGIMVCKLVNKLLASEGHKGVSFQKKLASAFVAMSNIDSFNKGIKDYGIRQEFTVQSGDLWEGKKSQFLNVVNTLHRVGMLANEKGFEPTYTGQKTEYLNNE